MQRPGVIDNIFGSIGDAWRSLREIPFLYFMFVIGLVGAALFSVLVGVGIHHFFPGVMPTPQQGSAVTIPIQSELYFVAMQILMMIAMTPIVPAFIGMTRYFAAGDNRYGYRFGRPFWRVLGWGAIILVPAFVLGGALFAALRTFLPSGSPLFAPIIILLFIVVWTAGIWFQFRIYTFFGALSLNEPPPVFLRCFRETRGFFWYLILNYLAFVFAIFVLEFALLLGIAIAGALIFAVTGFLDSLIAPSVPFPIFSGIAGIAGFICMIGILLMLLGIQFALYGRLFRTIRASKTVPGDQVPNRASLRPSFS